ncbi:MAG: hypothetical protein PHU07_00330 [Acidocella sp.]|nr:hypothetical protein [Acidocella sp.]
MFETNPFPNIVNGQLWTIPVGFGCYIILAGVTLLRHGGEIVLVPGASTWCF